MADQCTHLPEDLSPPPIDSDGCEDCLAMGRQDWVHLRFCQTCGHVGCCDDSPQRHATQHFRASSHPLVRSLEPGEDWWFCYPDDVGMEIEGSPSAPSYS